MDQIMAFAGQWWWVGLIIAFLCFAPSGWMQLQKYRNRDKVQSQCVVVGGCLFTTLCLIGFVFLVMSLLGRLF